MRVWSVVSQKGGSGKTTLVLLLAMEAKRRGHKVVVIDLDPQRSAEQWADMRAEKISGKQIGGDQIAVVHGLPTELANMLDAAGSKGADLVLVDTPPTIDKHMVYASHPASLLIVPTRSDIFDRHALDQTLEYLHLMHALNKAVVAFNAPSKDDTGLAETRAMVTQHFDVPVLSFDIGNEVQLPKTFREGKALHEMKPKNAAVKKLEKLVARLFDELGSYETKFAARSEGLLDRSSRRRA